MSELEICCNCLEKSCTAKSHCGCKWLKTCDDCFPELLAKLGSPCVKCGLLLVEDEELQQRVNMYKDLADACRDLCRKDNREGSRNLALLHNAEFDQVFAFAVCDQDEIYSALRRNGVKASNAEDMMDALPELASPSNNIKEVFLMHFRRFLPVTTKRTNDDVTLSCWVTNKKICCYVHPTAPKNRVKLMLNVYGGSVSCAFELVRPISE